MKLHRHSINPGSYHMGMAIDMGAAIDLGSYHRHGGQHDRYTGSCLVSRAGEVATCWAHNQTEELQEHYIAIFA